METFSEEKNLEICDLISTLLLIQHKRLDKDQMYSDESLTNSYLFMPPKGDLFEYINELSLQMKNILRDLEE